MEYIYPTTFNHWTTTFKTGDFCVRQRAEESNVLRFKWLIKNATKVVVYGCSWLEE